jgi:hypothetical protein
MVTQILLWMWKMGQARAKVGWSIFCNLKTYA